MPCQYNVSICKLLLIERRKAAFELRIDYLIEIGSDSKEDAGASRGRERDKVDPGIGYSILLEMHLHMRAALLALAVDVIEAV